MIGKFLLSLFVAAFLGVSATAATTSKDVDIIVTHAGAVGGVLTSFTFVNNSGKTLSIGSPVSFGQAFRYGDIMPGTYPLIRDASNHTPLAGQQWDEISTWRENGGNGSWRHAVWAAWLPKDLAPGATQQFEFIAAAGNYSQSSHQALSALCGGPAAHDLKIRLTDVHNQNDTARDSGDATFRLCDNIANTGRDVPRHLRAGNVYDEYVVSGMFVYTSGHKDPLLYAQCNVDIFTKADGVSAGDVRWVCELHNSWQNVAAGSTGNAGNPGPAGFANDPQAVSYRVAVLDGASTVLDWSRLDATIASTSNPVVPAIATGCFRWDENWCINVPSSAGSNAWYAGQATRVSCTGTCVAGLTNGKLYYVWPSSSTASNATVTQYVALMDAPVPGKPFPMTGAQGSGTTTFSARVQHYHWESWPTLDASGQDNWAPFGTTSRDTRKLYPAFTVAEKRYWQESGLVVPITDAQPTPMLQQLWGDGIALNYGPMGKGTVHGGDAGGPHSDLGIVNEWAAKSWITQAEQDIDNARLFTLGTTMHGWSTLLNEATGRMRAANNGPPTGPGGSGSGGSYPEIGAPENQLSWSPLGIMAMASAFGKQGTLPYEIAGGTFNGGTGMDHMPSFDGFTYMLFGDRHFLNAIYWQGERDFMGMKPGPGAELGQGYYRDNNAIGPDGAQHHYYGLLTACCQTRGSTWTIRDVIYAATFGGDYNVERSLFNDMLTETANYWPLFLKWRDGPGSTGYSGSLVPPNDPTDGGPELTIFQANYVANVSYIGQTFLHYPMAGVWNTKLQRITEGVMGGQLAGMGSGLGLLPTYYVAPYDAQPSIQDSEGFPGPNGGNVGRFENGVDARDWAVILYYMSTLSGGQMQIPTSFGPITVGDQIKSINPFTGFPRGYDNLDQLRGGTRWYDIVGPIDNSSGTFYIKCNDADHVKFPAQCPVAGQAFKSFTRNGNLSIEHNSEVLKLRQQYDPGPGQNYADYNYAQSMGMMATGLKVLGYNVSHAMADFAVRANPPSASYNIANPSFWWDPTIVVPGLPTPVNSIQ